MSRTLRFVPVFHTNQTSNTLSQLAINRLGQNGGEGVCQEANKCVQDCQVDRLQVIVIYEYLSIHVNKFRTNSSNLSKTFMVERMVENGGVWRNALKRADIVDFRWHDLRHTWASWEVQNGVTVFEVQHLGGWSREALNKSHMSRVAGKIEMIARSTTQVVAGPTMPRRATKRALDLHATLSGRGFAGDYPCRSICEGNDHSLHLAS